MARKTSTTLDWLSIGEAAKYLGVSRDTLRRWEKRGKIKSYRTPGGRRKYTLYDLEFAMKSPKPAPLIVHKPRLPEPTPPRPEQSQIPADTRQGRISEIVEGPKPEPVTRPEPVIRPEPTMKPTPPLTEQALAVPRLAGQTPSGRPSHLRTLAVSFALILTLLVILPLAISALLTLLKGPGEILNPLPDLFRGF